MPALRPTAARVAALVVAFVLVVASTLLLSGRGDRLQAMVDLESQPVKATIADVVPRVVERSESETAIIGEAITYERRLLTEAIGEAQRAQTLTLWVAAAGYAVAAVVMAGTIVAMRREQTQVDLRRSEAQAKLDMLAVVAHELRSPLTAITGFTQILHADWKTMEYAQIQDFLGLINGQAEELLRLIDDLLTIRRIETGSLDLHPAPVRVADVAQRVSSSVFRDTSSSVEVDLDPELSVVCDPDRLAQILRNLLDNARKYGGPSIRVESDRHDGRCRISVIDDGAGVAPHDVERVFTRFDQGSVPGRTDTGFGLGLAIVKDLAQAMGGDVGYSPVAPNGARFWVDLPEAAAQADKQAAVG